MREWPPVRTRGGLLGLATALLLFLMGGVALSWAVWQPPGLGMLAPLGAAAIVLGIAAAVAVATIGYFRLTYQLGPQNLVIRSARPTEVIPLDAIDGIYAGSRVGRLQRIRGFNWPGYHVGVVPNSALGALRVFCTDLSVDALAVIVTADRTFLLSPRNPPEFRRELIGRIEAAEATPPGSVSLRRGYEGGLPHPVLIATMVVAAALFVAALGMTLANHEAMSATISAPTPAGAALSGPGTDVFQLPLLGGGLLGLNLVLALALRARERGAIVLLCTTACVVEAMILLAILRLLS